MQSDIASLRHKKVIFRIVAPLTVVNLVYCVRSPISFSDTIDKVWPARYYCLISVDRQMNVSDVSWLWPLNCLLEQQEWRNWQATLILTKMSPTQS
jgi:hypothetical protein